MIAASLRRLSSNLSGYRLSDEALAVFRIAFCLFALFATGLPDYSWIAQHPDWLFFPPEIGIASLFGGFPDFLLIAISVALPILFVLLLIGWRTAAVSVLISILLLVGNSFKFSFGKIDHDILFTLLPSLFAFSGWGNRLSMDEKSNRIVNRRMESEAILAILFAFGMLTSVIPKVWAGWLDFESMAAKGYLFKSVLTFNRTDLFALSMLRAEFNAFWQVIDWIVVIWEAAFMILVFFPVVYRRWLALAVLFHLGNTLTINIPYDIHAAVYLFFFDWNRFVSSDHFSRFARRLPSQILSYKWALALIVFVLLQGYCASADLNMIAAMKPTLMKLLLQSVGLSAEVYNGLIIWALALITCCIVWFLPESVSSKVKSPTST